MPRELARSACAMEHKRTAPADQPGAERVVAGIGGGGTEHGHPIARIVPLRPSALDQLTAEGRATEATADLLDPLDELSLPAASTGVMLPSAALAELRTQE